MSDASVPGENWAGYLRRMTKRPGWNVAKLARESGIHRGTIFKWLAGDPGVTIDSVRRIAHALQDEPDNALRAAGNTGAPAGVIQDEEVAAIMRAPVDDGLKQMMLRRLNERRERDRARRMEEIQDWIGDLASRPED